MASTGVSAEASEAKWLDGLLRAPLRLPLFARTTVEPGWQVERRVIREHLVYFVTKSACAGRVGGVSVELAAGSLLWVPPGVPFELSLVAPRRPITLMRFRLAMAGKVGLPCGKVAVVLPRAWDLRPAVEGVLDELSTHLPHREPRLRAYLVSLFTGVFRARRQAAGNQLTLTAAQGQRLAQFAGARWSKRPGAAELAAELRLSHDYFTRVFRRTFGMAPRVWISRERVRHAAMRLLDSAVNVSEVAEELGYPDVFAFSRQFKKVMGCSPRAYRRQH